MRQGKVMGQRRRDRKAERVARNKKAFDDVIGDPYAKPEPIEGHYALLRNRSSLSIAEPERQAPSPQNPARPNALDFFCDVESAVADGLDVWNSKCISFQNKFNNTYFVEDPSYPSFDQKERAGIEQCIGNILVARSISPVAKYFTTIRQ